MSQIPWKDITAILGVGGSTAAIFQWISNSHLPFTAKWVAFFSFLILLAVIYWCRFRFGWVTTPNSKDTVDEWTAEKPKVDRDKLNSLYRDLDKNLSKSDHALNLLDKLLAKIYGPVNGGMRSWRMSLLIAWCYPLLFLLITWLCKGSASFGDVVLLPPVDNTFVRFVVASGIVLFFWGFGHIFKKCEVFAPFLTNKFTFLKRWQELIEATVFIFTFVNVFAGALIFAGAVAGPFACTVAIAGTVTFTVASTGVVAGTVAFVGAGAVAFAVAGAVTGADVGAFAVALVGAGMFTIFIRHLENKDSNTTALNTTSQFSYYRIFSVFIVVMCWFFYLGLIATAPVWPWEYAGISIDRDLWGGERISFTLFFFLALMPLLNAFSDYLSVALTRWFISKYKSGAWLWMLFVIADIGVAVLLTFLLFTGTLYTFEWLQFWGWGVDAELIKERFLNDPWGEPNSWITLMAVTNLLPTLFHLAAVTLGLFLGVFVKRSNSEEMERLIGRLKAGESLEKASARSLYNSLYTDRYWQAAIVALVMLMFLPFAQLSIWYTLRWSLVC